MVRELIEANLDEKSQTVALEWLNKRIACYRAMIELGLLDRGEPSAGRGFSQTQTGPPRRRAFFAALQVNSA